MLRCLLLAPPGAGKGTQSERIASIYGVAHLSTGALLREQVARRVPIGEHVAGYAERGELVPDDLVMALVLQSLTELRPPVGFVLDGFPRTISQARRAYGWGTEHHLTFHAVIALDVPEEALVERVMHRRQVEARTDDTLDTFRRRLQVYSDSAAPLLEFYEHRGILMAVDGTGTVDEVTDCIRHRLDALDLR